MNGKKFFWVLTFLACFFSPQIASSYEVDVCPYGNGKAVFITVLSDRILDMTGGVRSFWVYAATPVYEHPLIKDPKGATVNATAVYPILRMSSGNGGEYMDIYPVRVPTAIEYGVGDKGGKLTYVNTELSPTYEAGGLQKAFVNAVLDPMLFEEDDASEVGDVMGAEFYSGPPVIPGSVTQGGTLDMAVYRGYTNIENKSPGRDVGFLFMLASRRSESIAPKIDTSGMPKLVLSLYRPSGKLYATRRALPGDHVVAISVPAGDNPESGLWKFVVEEASGFDGGRVVLTAVVDGIYDMYDPEWRGEPGDYSAVYKPAERPRGLSGGVLRHQLGDGENIGNSRVKEVLFGGLIDPDFVEVNRIDSDLELAYRGTLDKVVFRRWFEAPSNVSVRFERGGAVWSSSEIIRRAVTRAPDIIFYVASNDEYITRKDAMNVLSGSDRNTMFLPGMGDDIVIFGQKGNILYYRRGEGNDTILARGGRNSHRAIYFHRDIASGDVSAARTGQDMKISAAGGSITVKGWYESPDNRVEILNFLSDGTVWDMRDAELLAAGKPPVKREVIYTFDERISRLYGTVGGEGQVPGQVWSSAKINSFIDAPPELLAWKTVNDLRNLKGAMLSYYLDEKAWAAEADVGKLDQYLENPMLRAEYAAVMIKNGFIGVRLLPEYGGASVREALAKSAESEGLWADADGKALYRSGSDVWIFVYETQ